MLYVVEFMRNVSCTRKCCYQLELVSKICVFSRAYSLTLFARIAVKIVRTALQLFYRSKY